MRLLLLLIALLLAVSASSAPAATPGSFAELTEFRAASRLKPWRTLQASGYDRGGGFYDSGNFLREEPGRHYVMLETEGPGVIDRMWFTRKSVQEPYDLLLYLDDRAVRIGLEELCSGTRSPFVAPFVGSVNLARYCYIPLGFRSHCKAVLVPTAPPEQYSYRENSAGKKIPHVYYQLTYRKLPTGSAVTRFSDLDSATELRARERAAAAWQGAGAPLFPKDPLETREYVKRVAVPAGGAVDLLEIAAGGTIESLGLLAFDPAASRSLRLEGYWDGAEEPAISAPIGTLFAAPDRQVAVRGLWLGCQSEYYCYLPMPFWRSARLAIRSTAANQIFVQLRVRVRQEPPQPDDAYFYARSYDHQPPLPPTHYEVLNVTGRGHWVGLVMDRPGNMEGDDQFYVDGETTPSIHGTGTEDFFSFAWGFSHLAALPLHGITRHFGAAIPYRVHLPAGVPFRRSLRLVFEHGHANEHQGRYSGVALYYLAPNQRRAEGHPIPGF